MLGWVDRISKNDEVAVRRLWPGCKILKHLAGGVLFRVLLGRTLGAAYELGFRLARLQARLNRKCLVMLGPTLLYQHVLRLRTPRRLQFFLERRFVIVHRKHAAV